MPVFYITYERETRMTMNYDVEKLSNKDLVDRLERIARGTNANSSNEALAELHLLRKELTKRLAFYHNKQTNEGPACPQCGSITLLRSGFFHGHYDCPNCGEIIVPL